jgi:hypothetical protein
MDLLFIGGIALLWAAVAALIAGVDRLRPGRDATEDRP